VNFAAMATAKRRKIIMAAMVIIGISGGRRENISVAAEIIGSSSVY
jgi:hypothetical protein